MHVNSDACLAKVVDAEHRGDDILSKLVKDEEFPHRLLVLDLRQSVVAQPVRVVCSVEIEHPQQQLALNLSQRRRSALLW